MYDVIVVGASVAGLRATYSLAKQGLDVLCLDKKQEIGVPKQCGEGLSLGHLKKLGIKPKKEWAVQPIRGAILYAPNGKSLEIDYKKTMGYILERKAFEKFLAKKATKAGAKIKVRSNVVDVKLKSDYVEVETSDLFKEKYKAKMIFACDGPQSGIANKLGLKISLPSSELDVGFQYEMMGISFEKEEFIHLWFGNKVAPRGYVWLFPKGKNHANVGIGIGGHIKGNPKEYLDNWIKKRKEIEKGSIVEVNAGVIPVGALLEKMHSERLLVVGDAAHQVNPIHGGGMGLAMSSADLAANVAKKAIEKDDFSEKTLSEYSILWWEKYGERLKKLLQVRKFLEELNDDDFNTFAEILEPEDIEAFQSGSFSKIQLITKKLIKRPRLIKLVYKYLKAGA